MYCPFNYGFIPHTLSEDGDPVDAAVIGQVPVTPGVAVRSRPIGVLIMEDEAGGDEKIIAVPVDKLHPYFKNVGSYRDLPEVLREQVQHFFTHYKDLGKWVKVKRWGEPDEAFQLIREGAQRAGEGQAGKDGGAVASLLPTLFGHDGREFCCRCVRWLAAVKPTSRNLPCPRYR